TYKEYLDKPVRKYYNNILYKQQLIEVPELSERGKAWKDYELTVKDALSSIKVEDRKYDEVKTIHSMKGDEKNNGLVTKSVEHTQFILRTDLSKESHHIHFVAASRAKENRTFQVDPGEIEKIKTSIDKDLSKIIDRKDVKL